MIHGTKNIAAICQVHPTITQITTIARKAKLIRMSIQDGHRPYKRRMKSSVTTRLPGAPTAATATTNVRVTINETGEDRTRHRLATSPVAELSRSPTTDTESRAIRVATKFIQPQAIMPRKTARALAAVFPSVSPRKERG